MRKAYLFGAMSVLAAAAAIACQQTEDRPPISDGAGGGHSSTGSGSSDAGTSGGDGGAGIFASFPGYDPTGLATDGDTLYVTLAPKDTTVTNGGKIDRVTADGTITELVTTAASPSLPIVYSNLLFYSDQKSGVLSTIELIDLTTTTLPITPQDVVPNLQTPGALLDVGGTLYVAYVEGGIRIDSTPVNDGGAGSAITTLSGDYTPSGMVTDGVNVYFGAAQLGGSQVDSVPLAGGSPSNLWAGSDTGTIGLLSLSGGNVYFTLATSGSNGAIYGAPLSGGPAFQLANGLDAPSGLATTATSLYYTTNSATGGGVWKTPFDAPEAGTLPTILAFVPNAKYLALGATNVYVSTDEAVFRVAQ